MSDIENMLVDSFRRLLGDVATAEAIRNAESARGVPDMWREIKASGFLDALVSEDSGGAGLCLEDVFPLVTATGEFILPVPFAETMVARAILSSRGISVPDDAVIVLAPPSPTIPLAAAATHGLVTRGDRIVLVSLLQVGVDPFGAAGGTIDRASPQVCEFASDGIDLTVTAAGLTAAKLAGAMGRLLAMTLNYANEREQFGRPLSKFQVIQHQLAVMAEQVVSAHVAARIGMSGPQFDPLLVAAAKIRTSEASHQVVAIAHAVHGAIGVTEEYDLQLLTRRVKQWQLAFGSEGFWARRLGEARLAAAYSTSVDFIRQNLA